MENIENSLVEISDFLSEHIKQPTYLTDISKELNTNLSAKREFDTDTIRKINHSIKNIVMIYKDELKKFNDREYFDFYKVLRETGSTEYSYSFSKYNGIGKRYFCGRSARGLDIRELKIFLANTEAVNSFNKILGNENLLKNIETVINIYEEAINSYKDMPKSEEYPYGGYSSKYKYKINLSDIEQKLCGKTEIEVDIQLNRLYFKDTGLSASITYLGDNPTIRDIKFAHLLENHKKEISEYSKPILDTTKGMVEHYDIAKEKIQNELSKWLMVDMM